MYDHREVPETSVCLDKCLYIVKGQIIEIIVFLSKLTLPSPRSHKIYEGYVFANAYNIFFLRHNLNFDWYRQYICQILDLLFVFKWCISMQTTVFALPAGGGGRLQQKVCLIAQNKCQAYIYDITS